MINPPCHKIEQVLDDTKCHCYDCPGGSRYDPDTQNCTPNICDPPT